MQNAIKYSKATQVTIRLDGRPHDLTLSISDDGVGFDADAWCGIGPGSAGPG